MKDNVELPVPVLEHPHWRVNTYPEVFQKERLSTLTECLELIKNTKVRLRGWDYPHVSNRPGELDYRSNYIASWANFMGQIEYWRFYQSSQFLHLSTVREVTEPGWTEKLRKRARSRIIFHPEPIDWDKVKGFFSLPNTIYTFTEIFEFAARLCQRGVYVGNIIIDVQISDVEGFVLVAEGERAWHHYYATSCTELRCSWSYSNRELLTGVVDIVLDSLVWFFERFGWLDAPREALKAEISSFLGKR